MTGHPGLGFTDVYAAKLPSVAFQPSVHLNYAEAVMRMKDGLPKLKDFPAHDDGPEQVGEVEQDGAERGHAQMPTLRKTPLLPSREKVAEA